MMNAFPRRRGRGTATLAAVCTAALALSGCGSSPGDDAAPDGAPADDLRVVDLLDTTFDLGALGIAPVATPFLDRTFAERVLVELELPADIDSGFSPPSW